MCIVVGFKYQPFTYDKQGVSTEELCISRGPMVDSLDFLNCGSRQTQPKYG